MGTSANDMTIAIALLKKERRIFFFAFTERMSPDKTCFLIELIIFAITLETLIHVVISPNNNILAFLYFLTNLIIKSNIISKTIDNMKANQSFP